MMGTLIIAKSTAVMWKPLICASLLLVITVEWTLAQRAVPCRNPIFMHCHHYCESNCLERGVECIYHCDHGCGCGSAFVQRNNGGCRELSECEFEDKTSEEVDTTPTPCTDSVEEVTNANGDDRLNLLEFDPPRPSG